MDGPHTEDPTSGSSAAGREPEELRHRLLTAVASFLEEHRLLTHRLP